MGHFIVILNMNGLSRKVNNESVVNILLKKKCEQDYNISTFSKGIKIILDLIIKY